MSRRKILLGVLLVSAVVGGALWALDELSVFGPSQVRRPTVLATPPLKPNAGTSQITVPVVIELLALRSSLDDAAPRSFRGKRPNPIPLPFIKNEIGWLVLREDLALLGRSDGLTLTAPLAGAIAVGDTSTLDGQANDQGLFDFITGIFNQRGEVRGKVTLSAQPNLLPGWRIDPKLAGKVTIPEGGLSLGGITIDVDGDVKTAIDRAVDEQVTALQKQLRDDPTIEQIARREWVQMCRSIPLGAIAAGDPNLWLELRPTRAFASHPIIDTATVSVTLGVEAQTRIVAAATTPDCPFPSQLEIVRPASEGRFTVITPIEIPFADANRLLDAKLKGRKFPEKADAPAQVTVVQASVEPSGDRLLISLVVQAHEQMTWFGFDANATIYVWVRPQLDPDEQMLRLTDMDVDVSSHSGFGLVGAVARAALPYIKDELQKYVVFDLKPLAASARGGIESVIIDFGKQDDGISAGATVSALRMIGVEFDSKTVRVTAKAEGDAKIAITKLREQKAQ